MWCMRQDLQNKDRRRERNCGSVHKTKEVEKCLTCWEDEIKRTVGPLWYQIAHGILHSCPSQNTNKTKINMLKKGTVTIVCLIAFTHAQ